MRIYWDIIRFSFLRFFAYPWEIVASILKRVVEILFLILFWSLVVKGSGGQINISQIVSYFFISMGIRDLVMSHWGPFGGEIGNDIKSGDINKYLIKPVSIIPTLYSLAFGRNGMRVLLALINLIIGIVIFPPKNFISIILFLIFFILAWWVSFAYNLFQGTLYFHLTDAYGVRNALNNFIRVFSGEMIPLFLFPYTLGQIVRFTPFPSMVYGPTIALSTSIIDQGVVINLGIAVFWAVLLNILAYLFWKRSIKNYEAIGI
jgi:ABC-2 type transport system permease protein